MGTEYDLTTQKSGLLLTIESPLVPDLIRRAGPSAAKRFCRWIGLIAAASRASETPSVWTKSRES